MASRRLQTATCPATAAACDAYRFSFGEGWILKFINRAAATCGDSTPAGRRFRLLLLTNAEGRKLFNYCLWFCIETFGCGGPQPLELRTAMTLSCSAMRDSLPRHLQDRFVEWAAAVLARVVSWAALWLFPLDTALLDGRFRAACADVISLILLGGLAPDSVVPDRTWFRAVPAMAAEHHRLVENERIPGNSATLLRSADLEQDAWRLIPGGEKAPPGCVWDTRVLRNLSLPVLDEPVPPDWVLDDADAALLSSVRPKPKEHDDGSPVSKAFDETAAALARFAIRREDSREQTRRIRGDGELEVPEPDSERQAKSTRLLSGFGSLLVPSNTLKSGGGKLSTLKQLRSKESIITDAAMSDARRRVGVYRAALEAAENAERVAAKARLRYAAQSRKADRESAARTASIMLRPAAVAELASTFFEEERLRQMDMQESLRHFRKLYLAGH
ncbi:hypothetical protein FNF31_05927 [Cafeteria roenbergensis]|uniref:Uncharacterized protein n=1 Tax=Cafeteria roenbergensis TaxID=33653 RepID=A0A5A8CTV5_CAFRO|nr:hypothetical protein FNF31_05927 [Cafeteria roenbergensis]KAA0162706.1 hypothetical protein FNF28_04587 [Cafeteria roenbergensis]